MSPLREFLHLPKSVKDAGAWSDKRMPKSGSRFPLSKSRGVHLGIGWRWRVAAVTAGANEYQLLVAYHATKRNYFCVLAVNHDSDTLVLARLEYHSTHAGWHVHACCSETESRHWGRLGYPEMRRLPGKGKPQRNASFCKDDDDAMTIAARHFRIDDLRPPKRPEQGNLWQS
jgi:hypothetical protein